MNISEELRRLQALYPVGHRSPKEVQFLLDAVEEEWEKIFQAALIGGHLNEQMKIDAERFEARLEAYWDVATTKENETTLAPFVVTLFRREHLPYPDAVFPFAFANQVEAISVDTYTFWKALQESVSELPGRIEGAAEGVGSLVRRGAGGFLGGLGWVTVPLVLGAIFLVLKKRTTLSSKDERK